MKAARLDERSELGPDAAPDPVPWPPSCPLPCRRCGALEAHGPHRLCIDCRADMDDEARYEVWEEQRWDEESTEERNG